MSANVEALNKIKYLVGDEEIIVNSDRIPALPVFSILVTPIIHFLYTGQ